MKQMTVSQGRELSTQTNMDVVSNNGCTPAVMLEDWRQYSVILNLFGVKKEDIFIDVNSKKRELGVYTGKKTRTANNASFWIFGVPRDGMLNQISVKYKSGGLQVTIPRTSFLFRQTQITETRVVA